ncbi:MAG TPA: bifunctional enoyl-CoA hydratase/phosphate acetyltransferase [Halanaerobiales bacterium]|nr:bifunctional enoyl-CoA hydratase/phosphate acetyltransferase [Halanaerobiales bacterium]
MLANIEQLINEATKTDPLKLAVVAAADTVVIDSIEKATKLGIVEPILIGNYDQINKIVKDKGLNEKVEIVGTNSKKESAHKAMELIKEGKADYPMKGHINTSIILKALLNKKYGLRGENILSLVTLIYLEKIDRLVIMTDGGMNISPTLEDKVDLINNAGRMAHAIGIKEPKAAVLAAVEAVNPSMDITIEAASLSKMSDRGQIEGITVDGPLAFDNAISKEAAEHKGIDSPVAGHADILLVPDIEAGNILYKSLVFYGEQPSASVVVGAKVPLVITSRADRAETKLNSIALGKVMTEDKNNI